MATAVSSCGHRNLGRGVQVNSRAIFSFQNPGSNNSRPLTSKVGAAHVPSTLPRLVIELPVTMTDTNRIAPVAIRRMPASSFRAPRIARRAVAAPEYREPAGRNLGR
jgi:hypothetical protein